MTWLLLVVLGLLFTGLVFAGGRGHLFANRRERYIGVALGILIAAVAALLAADVIARDWGVPLFLGGAAALIAGTVVIEGRRPKK